MKRFEHPVHDYGACKSLLAKYFYRSVGKLAQYKPQITSTKISELVDPLFVVCNPRDSQDVSNSIHVLNLFYESAVRKGYRTQSSTLRNELAFLVSATGYPEIDWDAFNHVFPPQDGDSLIPSLDDIQMPSANAAVALVPPKNTTLPEEPRINPDQMLISAFKSSPLTLKEERFRFKCKETFADHETSRVLFSFCAQVDERLVAYNKQFDKHIVPGENEIRMYYEPEYISAYLELISNITQGKIKFDLKESDGLLQALTLWKVRETMPRDVKALLDTIETYKASQLRNKAAAINDTFRVKTLHAVLSKHCSEHANDLHSKLAGIGIQNCADFVLVLQDETSEKYKAMESQFSNTMGLTRASNAFGKICKELNQ